MAKKRKKKPQISRRQRQRMRLGQILFALVALIMILSFVISLVT